MPKRTITSRKYGADGKRQKTIGGFFGHSSSKAIDLTQETTSKTSSSPVIDVSSDEDQPLTTFKSITSSKNSSSSSSSSVNTKEISNTATTPYKIYCDLDGVLVDFAAGVRQIFDGKNPEQLFSGRMWGGIAKADSFYSKLPWMSDGKELWLAIRDLDPTPSILTGVPRYNKSRAQKVVWCERELGLEINHVDKAGKKSSHEIVSGRMGKKEGVVNVITCWSKKKHMESEEGAILIDDRAELQEDWEKKGGVFIHHTKTSRTLDELRKLGVLKSDV